MLKVYVCGSHAHDLFLSAVTVLLKSTHKGILS